MPSAPPLDRLAMRSRPAGAPLMHQNWDNLLFLHWPIEPALLRPLIPAPLEIDTFEDKAWIGITPFEVTHLNLYPLPPLPGLDSFIELNVRTYVHYRGMPGIWFFSLDASKTIPVVAARISYALPYFRASMQFTKGTNTFEFSSRRNESLAAQFSARWQTGTRLRDPDVNSLAFFLVERYAFLTVKERSVSMTRVYHHPWILDEAIVSAYSSNMISTLGLPEPSAPPLPYFSRSVSVEIWPPAPI